MILSPGVQLLAQYIQRRLNEKQITHGDSWMTIDPVVLLEKVTEEYKELWETVLEDGPLKNPLIVNLDDTCLETLDLICITSLLYLRLISDQDPDLFPVLEVVTSRI